MKQEKANKKEAPESSIKSFKKMASETGRFYTSCLDILLESKTIESQQKRIKELLYSLPKPMQKLYKKGIDSFLKQTRKNQEILSSYGYDKKKILLKLCENIALQHGQKNSKEILNLLEASVKYNELIPGIPILELEDFLYPIIVGKTSNAVTVSATIFDSKELSYIITKKNHDNYTLKHELSHFIFLFLQKNKYLRQEKDKNLNNFSYFRDEVIAYITSQGFKKANFIKAILSFKEDKIARAFLNTDDKEEAKLANMTIYIIFFLMVIGNKMGVDMNDFIFPCLISREYKELIKNCNYLVKNELIDKWIGEKNNKDINKDILKFRKS